MTTKQEKPPTISELKELAKLPEAEASEEDLLKIIEYIKLLKEINTDDVSPTIQMEGMSTKLREDVVGPSLDHDEAMSQAPKKYNGFFVAPIIIDKE
jgi:aspartyl-tRNA(Asn)/glutamyl-tRNA(Gln) amidotransferase subunit C